jgi:hypothetical protein
MVHHVLHHIDEGSSLQPRLLQLPQSKLERRRAPMNAAIPRDPLATLRTAGIVARVTDLATAKVKHLIDHARLHR